MDRATKARFAVALSHRYLGPSRASEEKLVMKFACMYFDLTDEDMTLRVSEADPPLEVGGPGVVDQAGRLEQAYSAATKRRSGLARCECGYPATLPHGHAGNVGR